jgi:tetratricopeptide (TPR) repeat protein
MHSELEELHRQASVHYLKGEFTEAMSAWRKVLEVQPDDERGREGMRLCEQLAGEIEAARAASGADSASEPGGEPDAAEIADEPPEIDGSAASELLKRIEALMEEAQALADQQEVGEALSTIDRVLILDEENEAALALREQLEEPQEGPSAPGDKHEAFELSGSERSIDIAAPELEEPVESVFDRPPDEAETPIVEPTPNPKTTAAESPRRGLPQMSLPPWARDRRVLLGAGGLILLAAVFVMMQMMGGEAAPFEAPTPAKPVANAASVDPPVDPETEGATDTTAPPEPTPVDTEPLLREAHAAFDAGDYAQAVILYNKVLELRPNHAQAKNNMEVATERYREQKELREQWDNAVVAFEEGNYREALRLFYRMKQENHESDLTRCKVSGWYNLGVVALQARNCGGAVEHLEEAVAIAPQDSGVLAALELAEYCPPATVVDEAKGMRLRALTD